LGDMNIVINISRGLHL